MICSKATGTATRSKRYRQRHRRIDYKPSAQALPIINRWWDRFPGSTVSEVIDYLLRQGDKAVAGNGTAS